MCTFVLSCQHHNAKYKESLVTPQENFGVELAFNFSGHVHELWVMFWSFLSNELLSLNLVVGGKEEGGIDNRVWRVTLLLNFVSFVNKSWPSSSRVREPKREGPTSNRTLQE